MRPHRDEVLVFNRMERILLFVSEQKKRQRAQALSGSLISYHVSKGAQCGKPCKQRVSNMTLYDIIRRPVPPLDWNTWSKIPWDDPAFSERMLENHLSQEHDWASRTTAVIDEQVAFINKQLPKSADILDLGCGPGLYTERFQALGHRCTGVDFSPASIRYAKTRSGGGHIDYALCDVRQYQPEKAFDAVLLLFGEINVFPRAEASAILARMARCLRPGGKIFLEVHTFDAVREAGHLPATWQSFEKGLFSDKPHLCLEEHFWNDARHAAMSRYFVIDAESSASTEYSSQMQAYSDKEYEALFHAAGLRKIHHVAAGAWPTGKVFEEKLHCYVCSA